MAVNVVVLVAKGGEQFRHQSGIHRGAAVGVDGVRGDAVTFDCFRNELNCQFGTFMCGNDF